MTETTDGPVRAARALTPPGIDQVLRDAEVGADRADRVIRRVLGEHCTHEPRCPVDPHERAQLYQAINAARLTRPDVAETLTKQFDGPCCQAARRLRASRYALRAAGLVGGYAGKGARTGTVLAAYIAAATPTVVLIRRHTNLGQPTEWIVATYPPTTVSCDGVEWGHGRYFRSPQTALGAFFAQVPAVADQWIA